MSYEENKKVDEEDFDKLNNEIRLQFPDAPFTISLSVIDKYEDLHKLDEPFTDEEFIFICDDRIDKHNYYYSEWPEEELNDLQDFIVIERESIEKPITLRQIINEMIKSEHYTDEDISGDFHNFLVDFYRKDEDSMEYYADFES
jgi:hypothetical protein